MRLPVVMAFLPIGLCDQSHLRPAGRYHLKKRRLLPLSVIGSLPAVEQARAHPLPARMGHFRRPWKNPILMRN